MKFEIKYTEVIDDRVCDENDIYLASGVSVRVDVETKGNVYVLDYQTSGTLDYGAISSNLRAYDGHDDYDRLMDLVDDDEKFFKLLDEIKQESDAQGLWNEYIDENYIKNDDHYGGMDANSETGEMTMKLED